MRQYNEWCCETCRNYEECESTGVFDDDPGFDFCVNYESYPDESDNDEND